MTQFSHFYRDLFKSKIARYLGIDKDNIFLFWKGRVALYAILKAIGIKENDQVIIPAFTCVAAVNPIIYLGAIPIYVDIDSETYTLDVNKIEEKINPKVKAIIAQNTFGLSSDLDAILKLKKKYNLFIIEDCAHGFGGHYKGRINGTIADASFFSSQWNKPFSTGIGGIAVSRYRKIAKKLTKLVHILEEPLIRDIFFLKVLVPIKKNISNKYYWFSLKKYRWLSNHNLVLGSSQKEELVYPQKPKYFEKALSEVQAKIGLEELRRFHKILEHRRKISNFYKEIFSNLDIKLPYEPDYSDHTYLRFPFLVRNRSKFFALSQKEKIEIGDWFLSPVHPITRNLNSWHYKWGNNPIAEKISKHIVNLPTHMKIDEKYVTRIENFLRKNRRMIFEDDFC